jgi:mono/diheme cytochrome c family protein
MLQHIRLLSLGATLIAIVGCGGEPPQSPEAGETPEAVESMAEPASEPADEAPGAATEGAIEPADAAADAAAAADLPEGVTAAMVDDGRAIYSGPGICFTCHGPDGSGVPGLGSNLTDGDWLHSDGSFEGIVTTVTEGVSMQQSSTGVPMVPRGGSSINDEQVRAVAAYVWTLGH